jgi:hypothetical protein
MAKKKKAKKKKAVKKKKAAKKKKKKKPPPPEPTVVAFNEDEEKAFVGSKGKVTSDIQMEISEHSMDPRERQDYFDQWTFYVVDDNRRIEPELDMVPEVYLRLVREA